MTSSVQLRPLLCPQCQAVLRVKPMETAWQCRACGSGVVLSRTKGLHITRLHFQQTTTAPTLGKPYWLLELGEPLPDFVGLQQTTTQLLIPAYETDAGARLMRAQQLLFQPPHLFAAEPFPFQPAVIGPDDLPAWLDLLLRKLKASPGSDLKHFTFDLQLRDTNLWILPD